MTSPIRLAYLGPPGAFAEAALITLPIVLKYDLEQLSNVAVQHAGRCFPQRSGLVFRPAWEPRPRLKDSAQRLRCERDTAGGKRRPS